METVFNQIVDDYDAGRVSRRQLIRQLGAVLAAVGGGARVFGADASTANPADAGRPTFMATELNHIALRVTDVGRSRDFYMQHLGLQPSRENGGSAFLNCGKNFVALFRGSTPGLDHYCYSVRDYDVRSAEEKLRAAGLPGIRRTSGRIYFDDPDGITVQLAAEEHLPT